MCERLNHQRYRALVRAASVGSLAGLLGAANANAAATLEEVTVTAQKRTENVQDVPIAISAFSADKLAEKGVTNVAQVSNFTPNIQIDRASPFAGSSTIISAFIRGIGQNDFAFNMEPGVGLYVDGVYYARTVGAAIDLLDVERVEVLKGPQGTLFGRNTIGGALHVITRRPGDEFSSKLEVTTGSYNRFDVRGTLDIPLIDNTLYSSVSFSSVGRDGYQKRLKFDPTAVDVMNPITGSTYEDDFFITDTERYTRAKDGDGSSRQGGENADSLRAKFLYTLSDTFEVTLGVDATRSREEASPMTLVSTEFGFPFGLSYNACVDGVDPSTLPIPIPVLPALAGVCDVDRGPVDLSLADATNRLPWGDHFVTGDKDTNYSTGSNYSDVDTWGVNLTADWDIGDMTNLKSITSYRELESVFGVDTDGSPIAMIDTSFTMNQEQFSQEFQLNIDALDGRLHSVLGAYYFQEEGDLLDTVTFAAGLLQVFGPNDLENKAYAVFTHNNFQLTDDLGLTLGVRYTEEEKSFVGGQRDLSGFPPLFLSGLGLPPMVFPGFEEGDLELLFPRGENNKDFDDLSVRAGLEYFITPDVMTYVSYAQGYKTGGWTTRLAAPLAASAALAPAFGAEVDPNSPPEHDSETADTYEIGVKSELLGRRLRLNAALFSTDYDDIQVVGAPTYTLGAPWFFNAGDARIRGAEIEMEASLGPNLIVNGAVGYLDAEYLSLDDTAVSGGITLDNKLMNVPEVSANLGATYTADLSGGAALMIHGDIIHKGEMARNLENTIVEDGYTLANLSLTFEPGGSDWQLVLGGENVTDERYIVTGNHNTAAGAITHAYNRPHTWYLTFRHNL